MRLFSGSGFELPELDSRPPARRDHPVAPNEDSGKKLNSVFHHWHDDSCVVENSSSLLGQPRCCHHFNDLVFEQLFRSFLGLFAVVPTDNRRRMTPSADNDQISKFSFIRNVRITCCMDLTKVALTFSIPLRAYGTHCRKHRVRQLQTRPSNNQSNLQRIAVNGIIHARDNARVPHFGERRFSVKKTSCGRVL